ncbi:MAG: TolC family protein, partial [Mariprofundaceae bacterium]|nr:TolC family protein [Mariprofundaceae bacterium]
YEHAPTRDQDTNRAVLMSLSSSYKAFLEKLEGFSARYDAVTEEMNSPDVAGNVTRMVKLAKEHANLKRLVDPYREYRRLGGLIEEAEALQAEALLAARRTDLQRARSQRQADESTLLRLMRSTSKKSISLHSPALSAHASAPDFDEAERMAIRQRPDIHALNASLKAAEAQLEAARDIDAAQIDMVAQLGSRSLDARPDNAAGRSFSLKDRYASLSVEMQDNVGRNTARAAIRKAELTRQRLADQRRLVEEQVRDDLAVAITAIQTGIPNLRMARLQAVAEKKKYQAELERYRNGRSDTATLVQFEGELRNAELQQRLQQQALQLARYQLAWATGRLFKDLHINLNHLSDSRETGEQP